MRRQTYAALMLVFPVTHLEPLIGTRNVTAAPVYCLTDVLKSANKTVYETRRPTTLVRQSVTPTFSYTCDAIWKVLNKRLISCQRSRGTPHPLPSSPESGCCSDSYSRADVWRFSNLRSCHGETGPSDLCHPRGGSQPPSPSSSQSTQQSCPPPHPPPHPGMSRCL